MCAALSGCDLAAVCSLGPDLARATEELQVPGYEDAGEMARCERLEACVIATPTHLHLLSFRQVLAAPQLRAVLIEKPLATTLEEADAILQEAAERGVAVLVGHQRRHSARVQACRTLVTAPDFALRGLNCTWALLKPAPYFAVAGTARAYVGEASKGGPVLINLIHDVDLIRFITGQDVARVSAMTSGRARSNDVEDTGAVILTLANGAVGSFFFTDACPSPWSYEFATAENAKYPPLPEDAHADCYQFFGGARSVAFPSLRAFGYPADALEPGWDAALQLEATPAAATNNPLEAQLVHFLNVANGEQPLCTGQDGRKALQVVLAIAESAQTGMPVDVTC